MRHFKNTDYKRSLFTAPRTLKNTQRYTTVFIYENARFKQTVRHMCVKVDCWFLTRVATPLRTRHTSRVPAHVWRQQTTLNRLFSFRFVLRFLARAGHWRDILTTTLTTSRHAWGGITNKLFSLIIERYNYSPLLIILKYAT